MSEFFRGARVKPKPAVRAQDFKPTFPQAMLVTATIAVEDAGIRDKEQFLRYCGIAFDFALKEIGGASVQQSASGSEGET